MVKVYAITLGIGFLGLIVVVMGGALAENLARDGRDPGRRLGSGGRIAVGSLLGFGMGGMAAEFSPMDLEWPLALVVAVIAAGLGAIWVRFSARLTGEG